MSPWAYGSQYLAQNQQLLRDQEEATARLPPEYFAAFKQLVGAFLQLDITSQLDRILCATPVISAERDLLKGPRYGRRVHTRIPGSTFVVIPGAGHAVVLERPDLVAEYTIGFIDRQRDPGT